MSFYKLDTKAVAELVAYYEAGHSLEECAVRFQSNYTQIRGLLKGCTKLRKGRLPGGALVQKLNGQDYAAHIEKTYPGITKLLGNTGITLESIGKQYGISRERVRQFERRLETPKRLPLRLEAGRINRARRKLAQQEGRKARKKRWVDLGNQIALLIASGCSRAELVKALPWEIRGGKTPINQRISGYLGRLRTLSGVYIPKPAFFTGAGVPVGTKRKV